MKKYPSDEKLVKFATIFKENGFSLYLVGGAVRDFLLGVPNNDCDFTTDATPEEVKSMFRKTIDTGIKHGTVTVLFKGESYEVTTFRTEGEYRDRRHPDGVKFVRNLSEDLKRRDFTINAFACDIYTGDIIDLHGGEKDLGEKRIRAIGVPKERFEEDALRMMRACRFAAKLSFEIEPETLEAMKLLHENIKYVSAERIKDELFRLILSNDPVRGLSYMEETGLLELILPELHATIGVEQGGDHRDDVWTHSINALTRAKENGHSDWVRLAALFHDIGKVKAQREGTKREWTFYGHEVIGAEMWEEIADRLKCSNEEKETVSKLIREHMWQYDPSWTDGAVRRFMRRCGKEYIPMLFDLRRDDAEAITSDFDTEFMDELSERIAKEEEKHSALEMKDLAVNGRDLIKNRIVTPGPEMGEILKKLLEEVIENPELNTPEDLLRRASELSGK